LSPAAAGVKLVEREPEEIALQVVSRLEQNKPPLDLNRTLERFGDLQIVPEALDGDGYLLEFGSNVGEILVKNESLKSYRWRFTVAHELGHWIVNRFSERSHIDGPPIREATQAAVERWCNKFAASLLMPLPWVKRFVGSFESLGKPEVVLEGSNAFEVSREAFYWRIHQIYKILIAEVAFEGDWRIWPVPFKESNLLEESRHSLKDQKKMMWGCLAERISSEEWGKARVGTFSKGPVRVRFRESPQYGFGGMVRWVVLIPRMKLKPVPEQTEIHGFTPFGSRK
jgi:Zn-dependent peptidase ImmA (M78 family)